VVWPSDAHISHVAEPEVVEHTQGGGWRLNHRGPPRFEVLHRRAVRRFGVRVQEQPPRVRPRIAVEPIVCEETIPTERSPRRKATRRRGPTGQENLWLFGRRPRQAVQEDIDAAPQVTTVVDSETVASRGTPPNNCSVPNGDSTLSGDASDAMAGRPQDCSAHAHTAGHAKRQNPYTDS
jgi:hypothetical protein